MTLKFSCHVLLESLILGFLLTFSVKLYVAHKVETVSCSPDVPGHEPAQVAQRAMEMLRLWLRIGHDECWL